MTRQAWIIGGTSGIGLATAERLRHHVDEVVAVGRGAEHAASARQRLGERVTIEQDRSLRLATGAGPLSQGSRRPPTGSSTS